MGRPGRSTRRFCSHPSAPVWSWGRTCLPERLGRVISVPGRERDTGLGKPRGSLLRVPSSSPFPASGFVAVGFQPKQTKKMRVYEPQTERLTSATFFVGFVVYGKSIYFGA